MSSSATPHRVLLLLYASAAGAGPVLATAHSLVVGPTSGEALADAVQTTLAGERYRHPQLAAVLGLSPRQHTRIGMLQRGTPRAKIARAIGLSEHRLRHLGVENLGRQRQRQVMQLVARGLTQHVIALGRQDDPVTPSPALQSPHRARRRR